jgi:GAF domain-containing protein
MSEHGTDSEQRYLDAIGRLSQVLVDAPTLQATLEQLLAVTTLATPDVTALSITAASDDGELTSAASTDERAREVDEHEFTIAEGPCIEALATGEEQLVRDTEDDDRWPRFARSAAEHGFRSVAGLPLRAPDGTTIGALNAFGTRPNSLSEEDLSVLRRVCSPAAAVLANARAYRRTSSLSAELAATLEDQATVHRAVGVLLGRDGGTPEAALDRLRRGADRSGSSVVELAARVTAGELEVEL